MQLFRKTVIIVLVVAFLLCIGSGVFIHLAYAYSMPYSPQPQVGRVHQITVNHGYIVYVTGKEFRRAHFILNEVFWFGWACAALLAVIKVYWKPPGKGAS